MVNNLGAIIKQARLQKGLTVRQLAMLCHINHTDVSKLEHNKIQKPSLSMLVGISDELNTNLIAACLEDDATYLQYKNIINKCSGLNQEQINTISNFIDTLR